MKFHDAASTVTNLAFIAVGISALSVNWYAGLTIIVLGFTSWMYHSQKTRFWQNADMISIYFVFCALINYLLPWDLWPLAFFFAGLLGIYHSDLRSHLVIGLLGAITFLLISLQLPALRTLLVLTLFAGWGAFNWLWLNRDKIDMPDWFFDATHSITHVFAAMGMYYML